MALTVGQADAVSTIVRWLGRTPNSAGVIPSADRAAEALALLAKQANNRLMAGPGAVDAEAAVSAVAGERAELDRARDLLAAYRRDDRHIIDLRSDGWTIQHPLACRPNLFACAVNRAAVGDLTGPPAELGRFYCDLVDGSIAIGERVPDDSAMPAEIPAEVIDAALLAYDESLNELTGSPPGTVLGPAGRERLLHNPAVLALIEAGYWGGLAAQPAFVGLTEQWAALYNDGTWTSGAEQSREEAEEIIATARAHRKFSRPVLAHRLVGPWQTEGAASGDGA